MKKIFCLLILILNSVVSFSQSVEITLSEFEKLCILTTAKFEDWALEKNLSFEKMDKYEKFDVIKYFKKNKLCVNFGVDKSGKELGEVDYQTTDKGTYQNLKESMVIYDYKFIKSESYNGIIFHIYRSNKFEIKFWVSELDLYYGYCIAIKKR